MANRVLDEHIGYDVLPAMVEYQIRSRSTPIVADRMRMKVIADQAVEHHAGIPLVFFVIGIKVFDGERAPAAAALEERDEVTGSTLDLAQSERGYTSTSVFPQAHIARASRVDLPWGVYHGACRFWLGHGSIPSVVCARLNT